MAKFSNLNIVVTLNLKSFHFGIPLSGSHTVFSATKYTTRKMGSSVDIKDMRKPYKSAQEVFVESQLLSKNPFVQFNEWFQLARNTPGIIEANAMCLSTATKNGKPSSRMVLLKGVGEDGFKFFTNYGSRKSQELDENPFAALMFYWEPLNRSVRIEGRVNKLSAEESTEYFHSRPKSSQIGACVSPQSTVIASRDVLALKEQELLVEYADKEVPKPLHWGGYRVIPDSFEFWQGQTSRIHDRILFRKLQPGKDFDPVVTHEGENGWVYERLAP